MYVAYTTPVLYSQIILATVDTDYLVFLAVSAQDFGLVSCPDSHLKERSGYAGSNPGTSIKILMWPIGLQEGVNCVSAANQIA